MARRDAAEVLQAAEGRPMRKKRMRQFGKVEIPQEAFIQALKMDS
jgi:GTP-binding protein LepA